MKTKIIFTTLIAGVFITALILYHDTMSLAEIFMAFISVSSTISAVWQWFRAEEKEVENKFLENLHAKNQSRIEVLMHQNDALFAKAYCGKEVKVNKETS